MMAEGKNLNDIIMYHDLLNGENLISAKPENIAVMSITKIDFDEDESFMFGSTDKTNYRIDLEEFALNLAFQLEEFRVYRMGYKFLTYDLNKLSLARKMALAHRKFLLSDLCKDSSYIVPGMVVKLDFLPHMDYNRYFTDNRLNESYTKEESND